jgi:hypothetical protein
MRFVYYSDRYRRNRYDILARYYRGWYIYGYTFE